MSDNFRKRAISELVKDLNCLSCSELEQVGVTLLTSIVGKEFEHRGCTIKGSPRKCTVDATADGAKYVYEASISSKYFDEKEGSRNGNKYTKINNDLQNALAKHPNCKKIWLLSTQEKSPTAGTEIANLITSFNKQHGKDLKIWDARQIAKRIVDRLDSDSLVKKLAADLPSLERLADESAFSHQLPANEDYISQPEIEKEIWTKLQSQPVVTIHGLSGAGKSSLAIAVAKANQDNFDTMVWYDARNLKRVSELSAAHIGRYQQQHNLAALLKRRKVLLILDDLRANVGEELNKLAISGSKILITTQVTSARDAVAVTGLDEKTARELLCRNVSASCTDEQFQAIWGKIRGYPLLLKLLNVEARETSSWDRIVKELDEIVRTAEDELHEKVCQRILKHHKGNLAEELAFIRWVGTSTIDPALIRACISYKAQTNLKKRGFLSASLAGILRIHDLVYQAVLSNHPPEKWAYDSFRSRLIDTIEKECSSAQSILETLSRRHVELFERLQQEDPTPAFCYMLALARPLELDLELLGDPVDLAKTLSQKSSATAIEVRAVIEAIEAGYSIRRQRDGRKAAGETLEIQIEAFDSLMQISSLPSEIRTDLRHHRAKMLIRLDKKEEALKEFKNILSTQEDFAAAQLQAARLLKDHSKPEALEHVKSILSRAIDSQDDISINVQIEALVVLADVASGAEFANYDAELMAVLKHASNVDLHASHRLVSRVAAKQWYENPAIVRDIFKAVDWLEFVPPDDDARFAWAQAHKSVAKALKDLNDEQEKAAYLERAIEAYEQIRMLNRYQRVQYAEALILLSDFNGATSLLEKEPKEHRDAFWYYRNAQALRGQMAYQDALSAIDNAIEKVGNRQKYKSTFLREKAYVLKAMGNTTAIDVLTKACDLLSPGDKFREQIEQEIASWKE